MDIQKNKLAGFMPHHFTSLPKQLFYRHKNRKRAKEERRHDWLCVKKKNKKKKGIYFSISEVNSSGERQAQINFSIKSSIKNATLLSFLLGIRTDFLSRPATTLRVSSGAPWILAGSRRLSARGRRRPVKFKRKKRTLVPHFNNSNVVYMVNETPPISVTEKQFL